VYPLLEDLLVAKTTKTNAKVSMDRRDVKDRRSSTDRRTKNGTVKVERRQGERRAKVNRRRQIDPTTCERDYSVDEIEFMQALDAYKRSSGRMFPTCSEVLEVLRGLGYHKRPTQEDKAQQADCTEPVDLQQQCGLLTADTGQVAD